jgi:hypothetical protein
MGNGPEFWQTIMGHRLIESDIPRMMKALERIALSLEKMVELEEKHVAALEKGHALHEQSNALHEQDLDNYRRDFEWREKMSQCDCPECVARREAESQAKG